MKEKVFLAGTDDVKYIMETLEKELKIIGYDPIWFHKKFEVSTEDTMKTCLDNVRSSDRLILVLNKKYGLPSRDTQHSITEEEFLVAYNNGKPILIFIEQETYAQSKIYRNRIKQGEILTEETKNRYGFKADIELFDFINRIQHLEKDGRLNIRWRELFDSIKDIVDQIKLKWGINTKRNADFYQAYNPIESKKFQKLYDRIIKKDKNNVGIDMDNLINITIGGPKFREVMGFFPNKEKTVFGNNRWGLFLFLHTGGYIAEITNLITKEIYDFFHPNVNKNVLYEFLEYYIKQCKKNEIIISTQESDLIESIKSRKLYHIDQQKWQDFYDRMANTDPKHLGIDIQYLLNNKILESDFENVLKMNVGAIDRYFIIYSNQEWYFSFINNRMGSDHYEIIIRNENTQDIFDFFNPKDNIIVLSEWMDYIIEYCAKVGIKIERGIDHVKSQLDL